MSGHKYINEQTLADLDEIQRLLAEAYEHYMADPDNGGWKSMEGAITLYFPEFYWIEGFYGPGHDMLQPSVSIYSYALGPSGNHSFKTTAEALTAVREWHKAEMERDEEAG